MSAYERKPKPKFDPAFLDQDDAGVSAVDYGANLVSQDAAFKARMRRAIALGKERVPAGVQWMEDA